MADFMRFGIFPVRDLWSLPHETVVEIRRVYGIIEQEKREQRERDEQANQRRARARR